MKNSFSPTGLIFIFTGLLFYFYPDIISRYKIEFILSIFLIAASLIIILLAFHKITKTQVIAAVTMFYIGFFLLVINRYEIFDTIKIIFPSLIIYIGTISVMLFLRDSSEKLFILIAIIFFTIGVYLLFNPDSQFSLILGKGFYLLFFDYWQIILFLFGLLLLLRGRNLK